MAYPSQHIDTEIPHGSRNHVIVASTIKSMFNIDIESTNKTRSIVKNVSRTLVKKKADGTAIAVTKENAIKKTFGKRFAIPLDFDFFKHPVYPYGLKEDLIVKLELIFSEKVILCNGDTAATYKLSDFYLEYDAIFDEPDATTIGESCAGTKFIPYTKVTSIL